MKRKRLNRDGWGFQYYPYWQMRIDCPSFHGLACLIRLTDGEANYWEMPLAGKVQVTGTGMSWLELVPDGTNRLITAMYFPFGTHDAHREHYPESADARWQPSVWYVDVSDGLGYDEDGIAVYTDKYLDVVFTPEGDIKVCDRDELEQARLSGELSNAECEEALGECGRILRELCGDIGKTDAWCAGIRQIVEDRIAGGEKILPCREVLENRRKTASAEEKQ